MDSLPDLVREGYLWRPGRRAQGRLAGMRYSGIEGPEAMRFFYDEKNIRRSGAIPEPILSTLFGHGAVHTLDGAAHRQRKAMFTYRHRTCTSGRTAFPPKSAAVSS